MVWNFEVKEKRIKLIVSLFRFVCREALLEQCNNIKNCLNLVGYQRKGRSIEATRERERERAEGIEFPQKFQLFPQLATELTDTCCKLETGSALAH